MSYEIIPFRPAVAAIAAVLALIPLSAYAQLTDQGVPPVEANTMAPSEPPQAISASPPALSSSPTTVLAPSSPVISSTPAPAILSNPQPAIPVLQPETSPPENIAPVQRTSRAKPVSQDKTVMTAPALKPASVPAREAAGENQKFTPVSPAATRPARTQIENAVAPIRNGDDTNSVAQMWAMALGVLAFMGAGSVLALRRRPDQRLLENKFVYIASPPAANDEPSEGAVVIPRIDSADYSGDIDREALAAARPSHDNPFLTRRNRLRRADFLLRQRAASDAHPDLPVADSTHSAADVPADRKAQQQVVYRITGKYRGTSFTKPGYN